jgi:hypothetical protein
MTQSIHAFAFIRRCDFRSGNNILKLGDHNSRFNCFDEVIFTCSCSFLSRQAAMPIKD